MTRPAALLVPLLILSGPSASAQFAAHPQPAKVPGVRAAAPGGAWLGADDCATPHTAAGTGTVTGVPFTTGTTGTAGQNEAECYFFGGTGVDQDVWYDWTATLDGTARLSTCTSTPLDTKVAVWPDASPSACPADGTSLACNDDACGLQSTAVWSVRSGTTYTLQLGTFPGASGGSGTFDVIQQLPWPCGRYDDGSTENSLGLTAGGELGWIHVYDCVQDVGLVQTAYGTLMFPGSVTNGNASRIALYDDVDDDPSNGATFRASVDTVVVNGDTDILNTVAFDDVYAICGTHAVLMATADHVVGEFPAPIDSDSISPHAWVVGSTLGPGTLDLTDLSNNSTPPMNLNALGFPGAWILRDDPNDCGLLACTPTLSSGCLGTGSGAACGCGNESLPCERAGCRNGLGTGAALDYSGNPDVTADSLVLTASGVTSQPGLFFQGDALIASGAGATFGDGIRCCGQNLVRLEVVDPPGTAEPTSVSTTVTISEQGPPGTLQPGDFKCYQYWYRDPSSSPCGSGFNLSSAVWGYWS